MTDTGVAVLKMLVVLAERLDTISRDVAQVCRAVTELQRAEHAKLVREADAEHAAYEAMNRKFVPDKRGAA